MSQGLRIVLAQANFCVGAIEQNTADICAAIRRARDEHGADLIAFPELAITGYPPEDLLFRPGLHRRVAEAVNTITDAARGIEVVVGFPEKTAAGVFNSAAFIADGRVMQVYRKRELPNYAVFDEKRYFVAGDDVCVVEINKAKVGISICEDIWVPQTAERIKQRGADFILNLNASPYRIGKRGARVAALEAAIDQGGLPIAYVNLVGGQDELVFDGGSMVLNATNAWSPTPVNSPWKIWSSTTTRHVANSCRCRHLVHPMMVWKISTAPWFSAYAITSRKTTSLVPCSGSPAASIRVSPSRSRPTRLAARTCMRSRCHRAIPRI